MSRPNYHNALTNNQVDIEGAELKILPDMVMTGALQHVDNLHMEWHGVASYRTGRY